MDIPLNDPLWVSAAITAILAIITGFYAWQTMKLVRLNQTSLLYQRKPYFVPSISNIGNQIFFELRNSNQSISPVYNVETELIIEYDDEKTSLGMYSISGPLLPGEINTQRIEELIIDALINKNLMFEDSYEEPSEDEFGNYFNIEEITYHIKKEMDFKLIIDILFESDIEGMKKRKYPLKRTFLISFNGIEGPDDQYNDNYETKIKMELGEWVQTADEVIVQQNGVRGLN